MKNWSVFFVFIVFFAIFARQFHIMSVTLSRQTEDLRVLIGRLKQRCLEAENRVTELQRKVDEHQARIESLTEERNALEMKYNNLQTGLDAMDNDPERIDRLKEKYLAMVSELDACIAALQHG